MAKGDEESCFPDCTAFSIESNIDDTPKEKAPGHTVISHLIELIGLFIDVIGSCNFSFLLNFCQASLSSLDVGPSPEDDVSELVDVFGNFIQKIFSSYYLIL